MAIIERYACDVGCKGPQSTYYKIFNISASMFFAYFVLPVLLGIGIFALLHVLDKKGMITLNIYWRIGIAMAGTLIFMVMCMFLFSSFVFVQY